MAKHEYGGLINALIDVGCRSGWKTLQEFSALMSSELRRDVKPKQVANLMTLLRGRLKKDVVCLVRDERPRKYKISRAKENRVSDEKLLLLKRDFLDIYADLLKELKKHPVARSYSEIGSLASRLKTVFDSLQDDAQ